MTEQQAAQAADTDTLRKSIHVDAPPAIAWRVLTEQMRTWWPLATHKIGATAAVDAIIEPRAGGRWYELGEDGSTCAWGRVLAWEPPARLVLSWEITADWKHDPDLRTEVEVRLVADGQGTRVELEHRGLDRYGDRRDEMRGIFDSAGGWTGILERFALEASRATR